jgi:proline iminopeptidase
MNDGYIGVPGGRVPLEALGKHRRVIFYDQLGCGNSDRPDNPAPWTVSRFVEELAQVRVALSLDRDHA